MKRLGITTAPPRRDTPTRSRPVGFRKFRNELARWYRTGTFFSNGRQLTWEYPRATPQGDQVDLVEVMDIASGLIAHHRVYWGWVGFKVLMTARKEPAS